MYRDRLDRDQNSMRIFRTPAQFWCFQGNAFNHRFPARLMGLNSLRKLSDASSAGSLPQCIVCPPQRSVSSAALDWLSLDSAEQLSQWFSSPLYYYSSDWRESVSSWGCESFMTTCSPFRQRYFHGIRSGHTAHAYWCLWLHFDLNIFILSWKGDFAPALLKISL